MNNIKRYSLTAFSPKTKIETLIGINVDGDGTFVISGKKGLLSAIDKYTMQFKDSDELKYNLLDIGIIDGDANLYIRYEQDGPRKTPILYSGNEKMEPFTDELSTYVSSDTIYFKKLLNQLLKSSKNSIYLDYMNRFGYINEYIYRKLLDYKDNNALSYSDLEFIREKIAKQLTSYKIIRDIYIGTKRYQMKKEIPNEGNNIILPVGEVERYRLDEAEQSMMDIFLKGGEEELYSLYDKEQISDKVLRKINEYHKKGL